jgi:hypothetical protein
MITKPDPAYAPPNVVTLLTAKGKRLTKTITKAGEKLPADTPTKFTHVADEVRDLEDLCGLLRWCSNQTDTYIVRPAVIEGVPDVIRRRCSSPAQSMVDVPLYALMVDIDKSGVVFPPDWMADPERHLRALIRKVLPPAFHDAGVIAQFSSGMSADGGEPRVHLWFWLDRPLISLVIKRWLKGCPIDFNVYSRGQPHFTAAPIFEDGVDPLGEQRLLHFPGPVVVVPDDIDTSAPEEVDVDMSVDLSRYVNLDLHDNRWRRGVLKIGDHEGGKGFHDGINAAAMAYISCHYDPQTADPLVGIDYDEFARAVLDHVRGLTLTPEREADLQARLADMKRCFCGAVPKVQAAIITRGIPFSDVPRGPSMTLLEMYDRGKAARDGAR